MDNKAHIYKITSSIGKIYVGSSVNIKQRFRTYKTKKIPDQPKLNNSLQKYGAQNHIFEIICECEPKDKLRLEAEHGHRLEVLGKNGLNCKLPKSDSIYESVCSDTKPKLKRSEETKKKISEGNKGKKMSLEFRQNQAINATGNKNMLGKIHSNETIEKMSASHMGNTNWLGKKKSPESIEKHRQSMIGQKRSDETKAKMSASRLKYFETKKSQINV